MAILPKREVKPQKSRAEEKHEDAVDSYSSSSLSNFEIEFNNENKSKKIIDNVKDKLLIRYADSSMKLDELSKNLKKINALTKDTSKLLNTVYYDDITNSKVKKETSKIKSPINFSLSSFAIPAAMLSYAMYKDDGSVKTVINLIKDGAKKKFDDVTGNILNISTKDKEYLTSLKRKTDKETSTLDSIVNNFSNGKISSFIYLIFGASSIELIKNFSDNIKTYSRKLYDIMGNVINDIKEWLKNTKIGKAVSWIYGGAVKAKTWVSNKIEQLSETIDGVFSGDVEIDNKIVSNNRVSKVAVYKAFLDAGFSPKQAAALVAEVGRENGFNANTLFGNHRDPASGHNIGFISWQGSRKAELINRAKRSGVLASARPFLLNKTYASLKVMADYVMYEMKTSHNNKFVRQFLANKDISYDEAAPILGQHYIVWAYGQSTIKDPDRPGKRKAFNWKAHYNRAKSHYKSLEKDLQTGKGEIGDFTAEIENDSKSVNVKKSDNYLPIKRTNITHNITEVFHQKSNNSVKLNKHNNTNLSSLSNNESPSIRDKDTSPDSGKSQQPDNIQRRPSFFDILIQRDISGNMMG